MRGEWQRILIAQCNSDRGSAGHVAESWSGCIKYTEGKLLVNIHPPLCGGQRTRGLVGRLVHI